MKVDDQIAVIENFFLTSKDPNKKEEWALLTHYFDPTLSDKYVAYAKQVDAILKSTSVRFEMGIKKLEKLIIKRIKATTFSNSKTKNRFTFIDLFSGLGGFRMALIKNGGQCVFSSEWDQHARKTYSDNYGEYPFGDITKESIKKFIPDEFDVLCAGFPCQPFSKGGQRQGFEDTRGTLFFDLCQIIERHKPKVILLENVANLATHDNGHTYKTIITNLRRLGYDLPDETIILSPDQFGVPILRPRIFIPCIRKDLNINATDNFLHKIGNHFSKKNQSIDKFLCKNLPSDLNEYEINILDMWNEFYNGIDLKIIGFPIWTDYFQFKGDLSAFPKWKKNFIRKNIELFQRNKSFIKKWLKKHDNLEWCTPTHRKMEWQAGEDYSNIYDCLIQFRPSGVRVKRPNRFATLVAMNHRQIIGKYKRRITIDESKRLQSFPDQYRMTSPDTKSLKQLGNSVNVQVIDTLFKILSKDISF